MPPKTPLEVCILWAGRPELRLSLQEKLQTSLWPDHISSKNTVDSIIYAIQVKNPPHTELTTSNVLWISDWWGLEVEEVKSYSIQMRARKQIQT